MNVRTKTVFYCDFCKKHGLSRHSMAKHERTCTLNPARECRWIKSGEHRSIDVARLASRIKTRAQPRLTANDLAWLHDEVDGCPPCMLAALRQSGVDYHYDEKYSPLFAYDEAVKEFRAREREDEHEALLDEQRQEFYASQLGGS